MIEVQCAVSNLGRKAFRANNQSSLLCPSHHFPASFSLTKILFLSTLLAASLLHFFWPKTFAESHFQVSSKTRVFNFSPDLKVHILILAEETSAIDFY